jgi:REP element-mobilizing transposase RayT
MAVRKIVFEEGGYYHVFNRGVDKKIIFHDEEDVKYFIDRLLDFNNNNPIGGVRNQGFKKYHKVRSPASYLVSIVAYCLLPNHFHLILRQISDDGITRFIQRVGTGYAKYYNKKYERSGTLFQGRFKATELDGAGSLEMLSVYVNLNYKHHKINPKKRIVKSSLGEYLGKNLKHLICSQREINNIVGGILEKNRKAYVKYSKMQSRYFIENKGRSIKDIKFKEFEE